MRTEVARALAAPFPRGVIKKTPQNLDYVPVAEVVERMNSTVGTGNWRVEVLDTQTWGERTTVQGIAPTHVIATVRVHVYDDEKNEWTWCDGMGGQDVGFFNSPMERWQKKKQGAQPTGPNADVTPGPLNLGDNFKGACSDAMKKALQHFGVALELARDGQPSQPGIVPEPEQEIDLRPYIANVDLTDGEREALKRAWKDEPALPFPAGRVPASREQECRTFIDSFVGTEAFAADGEQAADRGALETTEVPA